MDGPRVRTGSAICLESGLGLRSTPDPGVFLSASSPTNTRAGLAPPELLETQCFEKCLLQAREHQRDQQVAFALSGPQSPPWELEFLETHTHHFYEGLKISKAPTFSWTPEKARSWLI